VLDILGADLIGPVTGLHLLALAAFFGVLSLLCGDEEEAEEAAPGGDACC
jgi:hypothetical protein